MTSRAPEANWARLSAGIIYDPAWLACDAPARLLFLASIALAKATNRDGEFNLVALGNVMAGALKARQISTAADRLVELELWEHPGGGWYCLRSWAKWNETRADQAARKERHRQGALISNHRQHRHDETPDPDCPKCRPEGRYSDPGSERSSVAVTSPDADADADADAEPPPQSPPTLNRSRPPALDDDDGGLGVNGPLPVRLAVHLLRVVGLAAPRPTQGEISTVARCLARGWTPGQLVLLAERAASAVDPRAYLLACLRTAMNEDPPAPERRPSLDDQRPDCGRCGGSGWVGGTGEAGDRTEVERCPDCSEVPV